MPPPILARVPYTKRPVPFGFDAPWWAVELGNIQRAIPSQKVRTAFTDDRPNTTDSVVLYDASGAPITVTLPLPDQVQGLVLTLKKIDATGSAVTVAATIDGAPSTVLSAQYDGVTIVSSGSAYYLIGSF